MSETDKRSDPALTPFALWLFSVCVLAGSLIGAFFEPLRVASGVLLVLIVPGIVLASLWAGSVVELIGWGFVLNTCLHTLTSRVSIAVHGVATRGALLSGAVAVLAVGGLLIRERRAQQIPVRWSHLLLLVLVPFLGWISVVGRMPEETNYIQDTVFARAARFGFSAPDPRLVFDHSLGLERLSERRFRLTSSEARVVVENPTRHVLGFDFVFLLQNLSESDQRVTVLLNGKEAVTAVMGRRYSWAIHPRNYAADIWLQEVHVTAEPGRNELRLLPLSGDKPPTPVEPNGLLLHDYTGLAPRAFYRELSKDFMICDVGDFRETLDFSRNFLTHYAQYSTSYSGDVKSRGGYTTFSDEPPIHHLVCSFALLLIRDDASSASWLAVGEVALLILVLAELGASRCVAVMVGLLYLKVVRLGAEALTPDTLWTLEFVLMFAAILMRRSTLFVTLASVGFLTHVPAAGSAAFMILAAWLVYRERDCYRLALWTAAGLAVATVVLVVPVVLLQGTRDLYFTGQATLPIVGRTDLIRSIVFQGRVENVSYLVSNLVQFGGIVLLGGGLLVAFGSWQTGGADAGRRLQAGLVVALYFLAMMALTYQRAHHIGPIVFLLAYVIRPSGWCKAAFAAAAAASVVLLCFASPDYTGQFSALGIETMSAPTSRKDYYMECTERALRAGDVRLAKYYLWRQIQFLQHVEKTATEYWREFFSTQAATARARAAQFKSVGNVRAAQAELEFADRAEALSRKPEF